jgi:hypothetical protein
MDIVWLKPVTSVIGLLFAENLIVFYRVVSGLQQWNKYKKDNTDSEIFKTSQEQVIYNSSRS